MPDHVPDIELGECAEGIEVTPKGSCNITFKDGSTSKPQTDQRPDEEVANKPHPKDNTHGLWLLSNEIYSLVHLAVDSLVLLSLLLQLTVMAGKAVKLHTEKRHTLLLLILLTCIVNTIVAILVLYGQYLFIKVPQLRQLINMLRMEVNRMMDENNILCHNINNLEKEQHRLQDVEEKLQDIVQRQGGNVQQFRVLVQENASILHRQQNILKEQWKQEIIATVLRTDRNGDFVINQDEVDMLIHRIQSLEEEAGMQLGEEEEENLRRILTTGINGGKIGSVRALVQFMEEAFTVA